MKEEREKIRLFIQRELVFYKTALTNLGIENPEGILTLVEMALNKGVREGGLIAGEYFKKKVDKRRKN